MPETKYIIGGFRNGNVLWYSYGTAGGYIDDMISADYFESKEDAIDYINHYPQEFAGIEVNVYKLFTRLTVELVLAP